MRPSSIFLLLAVPLAGCAAPATIDGAAVVERDQRREVETGARSRELDVMRPLALVDDEVAIVERGPIGDLRRPHAIALADRGRAIGAVIDARGGGTAAERQREQQEYRTRSHRSLLVAT